jgi:MFS family permease
MVRTLAAVLELGCLFGALGAGVLADRVSRRWSIASACGVCGAYATCLRRFWLTGYSEVVFCIGSALQTWAQSLTQITCGRAIGGLGVGALRYSLNRPLDVPSKTFDRPPGTVIT